MSRQNAWCITDAVLIICFILYMMQAPVPLSFDLLVTRAGVCINMLVAHFHTLIRHASLLRRHVIWTALRSILSLMLKTMANNIPLATAAATGPKRDYGDWPCGVSVCASMWFVSQD
jgi:hypothetical protein